MFEGKERFDGQIRTLIEAMDEDLATDIADEIYAESQRRVPVKTGYLRDSGNVNLTNYGAEVRYEAPYAFFVEFGTYKMAAQPFLRPAIDMAISKLAELVRKRLRAKGLL